MIQKIIMIIACFFSLGSAHAMKVVLPRLLANKPLTFNFAELEVERFKILSQNAALFKKNEQLCAEIMALKEQIKKHKEVEKMLVVECENLAQGTVSDDDIFEDIFDEDMFDDAHIIEQEIRRREQKKWRWHNKKNK